MRRLHRRALVSFSHPSICHSDLYPALGTDNNERNRSLPPNLPPPLGGGF
jgi:hypothetical protein